MDSEAVTALVAEALARRGVVSAWEALCVPALVLLGESWEATGAGVDVEHLAAECVMAALHQHCEGLPVAGPPVLLACADEEQHSLPLHALAAALTERRVATRLLGGRVPRDALADAWDRAAPAAVMLWSQVSQTGDATQIDELVDRVRATGRPLPLLAVGGPGWSREQLNARTGPPVLVLADLSEAVATLVAATG
jgi:hypothetical protein